MIIGHAFSRGWNSTLDFDVEFLRREQEARVCCMVFDQKNRCLLIPTRAELHHNPDIGLLRLYHKIPHFAAIQDFYLMIQKHR